jgi:hypothetical protein
MNWYIAKVVFRINHIGKPQFDEHLRLIAARNYEEAFKKARLLGISEEDSFLDNRLHPVRWEFVNIADLYPIDQLTDGIELHSSIREEEEAAPYIRSIHQKAVDIESGLFPN